MATVEAVPRTWASFNEELHDKYGPAEEFPCGGQEWRLYVDDHCITVYLCNEGTVTWYLDDMIHREDGPAIVWVDGGQEWFLFDRRHRTDGPAIVYPDGSLEWWVDGTETDPLVTLFHGYVTDE